MVSRMDAHASFPASIGTDIPTSVPSAEARRGRRVAQLQMRRCASASPSRPAVSKRVRQALVSDGMRVRSDDFAWLRRRIVSEATALDCRDGDGRRPIDTLVDRWCAAAADATGATASIAPPDDAPVACTADPILEDGPHGIDAAREPAVLASCRLTLSRLAASRFEVMAVLTEPCDGVVLARPLGDPRVALTGFRALAGAQQVQVDDVERVRRGSVIAGHLLPATRVRASYGQAADAARAGRAHFTDASIAFRPEHRDAVQAVCAAAADVDLVELRARLFAAYVALEVAAEHQDELAELATMSEGSLVAMHPCARLLRCDDRGALIDVLFDQLLDELVHIDDDGGYLMGTGPDHHAADMVFDDGEIWLRGNQVQVEHYVARLMALDGVELTPVPTAPSTRDIESLDVELLRDLPS